MVKLLRYAGAVILVAAFLGYWHQIAPRITQEKQFLAAALVTTITVVLLLLWWRIWQYGCRGKSAARALRDSLVRDRVKMMQASADEESLDSSARKVRQFKFNANQLQLLQNQEEKPERPVVNKKSKKKSAIQPATVYAIPINFKLLEEFEWLLPGIEGTFLDFSKAVDKFTEILSIFISDEDEEQISRLLSQRHYSKLVHFFEQHSYAYQKQSAIAALLDSNYLNWLRYGHFLNDDAENSYFVVDHVNLKLYKEVHCLLQEIFIRYTNETQKNNFHSIADLLEKIPWENIEKLEFVKPLTSFGRDVLDVLVEDFLNSLKPVKRKSITEYRSLRMALRNVNIDQPPAVGRAIEQIIATIKATYSRIKNNAGLTQEEIDKLLSVKKIETPTPVKWDQQRQLEAQHDEEKKLRERIFEIVKFLGWFPQEIALISQHDLNLLDYFDKLLYSRRSRIAIINDRQALAEGKIYADRWQQIIDKLHQTEKSLETIEKQYGNLIGLKVQIVAPRQCEDYFPIEGTIESITKQPIDDANLIKFEIKERNHLTSYVVFIGNNVVFLPKETKTKST